MGNKVKRVVFTREMKKKYTILAPNMLPIHFKFITGVMEGNGYKFEILENSGQGVVDRGLSFVHNDACYPAVLVIGQFIEAMDSGRFDPHRVALMLMQTGGGCRASNYVSLLRKALARAGYGYVPVISLTFTGIETNPGFALTPSLIDRMLYAIMYADLIMELKNQCIPYEIIPGETEKLAEKWTERLTTELKAYKVVSYKKVRENYVSILRAFAAIPRRPRNKPRVGVVGEIYVKYSPLGNNGLEQFLLSEGAEVVVPGVLGFLMYCVYDEYAKGPKRIAKRFAYRFLLKKQRDLIAAMEEEGSFEAERDFEHTKRLVDGYIHRGAKMGEGFLLTAEMLELVETGTKNIICTQPFGCLPNHIMGKGMLRLIKEKHPESNIIAVDYDPGAPKINQENRIKLMLANVSDPETEPFPSEKAEKAAKETAAV